MHDYQRQLHTLYLANDILFKAQALLQKQGQGQDAAAALPQPQQDGQPPGQQAEGQEGAAAPPAAAAEGQAQGEQPAQGEPAPAQQGIDRVIPAFRVRLGRMLRATAEGGGRSGQALQALQRMIGFWAERGVYDAAAAAGDDCSRLCFDRALRAACLADAEQSPSLRHCSTT